MHTHDAQDGATDTPAPSRRTVRPCPLPSRGCTLISRMHPHLADAPTHPHTHTHTRTDTAHRRVAVWGSITGGSCFDAASGRVSRVRHGRGHGQRRLRAGPEGGEEGEEEEGEGKGREGEGEGLGG